MKFVLIVVTLGAAALFVSDSHAIPSGYHQFDSQKEADASLEAACGKYNSAEALDYFDCKRAWHREQDEIHDQIKTQHDACQAEIAQLPRWTIRDILRFHKCKGEAGMQAFLDNMERIFDAYWLGQAYEEHKALVRKVERGDYPERVVLYVRHKTDLLGRYWKNGRSGEDLLNDLHRVYLKLRD